MTTKLKIKLTKAQMREVLLFYTDKLSQQFAFQLATPAMLYTAQSTIASLREQGRRYSTNPAWDVEVEVVPVNNGTSFVVRPVEDANILYLDFDS